MTHKTHGDDDRLRRQTSPAAKLKAAQRAIGHAFREERDAHAALLWRFDQLQKVCTALLRDQKVQAAIVRTVEQLNVTLDIQLTNARLRAQALGVERKIFPEP